MEIICLAIEKATGKTFEAPSDFNWLSDSIMERTNEHLSTSTLMRLWGYREGVKPRKTTLDILAQYLGYRNYAEFLNTEGENAQFSDVSQTSEPVESHQRAKRQRKWVWGAALLAALLGIVVGSAFAFSDKEAEFVSDIHKLSNYRQYYIHTRQDKRGMLGTKERQLATTFSKAEYYLCDRPSTFALIQYNSEYFIYSTEDRRFINVLLAETDDPLRSYTRKEHWCAFKLRNEQGAFVFDAIDDNGQTFTLNVNAGNGLIITDWGTANELYDDGNLISLEDAGSFDPTEALSMLKQSEEKNRQRPDSIR